WFNGRNRTTIIKQKDIEAHYRGTHKTIPVYMIDNHHYFHRDGIYGFGDEAERYGYFCRSVLEMLPEVGWQPDVIHCNDWQSALIPLLLKTATRTSRSIRTSPLCLPYTICCIRGISRRIYWLCSSLVRSISILMSL